MAVMMERIYPGSCTLDLGAGSGLKVIFPTRLRVLVLRRQSRYCATLERQFVLEHGPKLWSGGAESTVRRRIVMTGVTDVTNSM